MHLCRSTSAFSMCPDGFKVGTLKPYSLKFETSNLHNWTWDLARPLPQDRDWGRGAGIVKATIYGVLNLFSPMTRVPPNILILGNSLCLQL